MRVLSRLRSERGVLETGGYRSNFEPNVSTVDLLFLTSLFEVSLEKHTLPL